LFPALKSGLLLLLVDDGWRKIQCRAAQQQRRALKKTGQKEGQYE